MPIALFCRPQDAVQSVKLLTNGYGDFNGQALVAFRLRGHRTKALAIRAPFVGSQQMRTWNPSSTPTPGSELVVLDLPPGTKESHLFDYYKVIPELSSIRLTMNRGYKTFVGKAVVGFSSKQGCMKAWNLGPVKVAGKQSRRWVKGRLEGKELFLKGVHMRRSVPGFWVLARGLAPPIVAGNVPRRSQRGNTGRGARAVWKVKRGGWCSALLWRPRYGRGCVAMLPLSTLETLGTAGLFPSGVVEKAHTAQPPPPKKSRSAGWSEVMGPHSILSRPECRLCCRKQTVIVQESKQHNQTWLKVGPDGGA